MIPLFFTLENRLPLMVIPDTQAHLDGPTILTYTYSVFLDIGHTDPMLSRSKESTLDPEKNKDPDYYGYITFEKPCQLFTYTADGQRELNTEEVNELIGHLSDVRDNPASWKFLI